LNSYCSTDDLTRRGDYFFEVKKNQRILRADIAKVFEGDPQQFDINKGHGRIENRHLYTTDCLKGHSDWCRPNCPMRLPVSTPRYFQPTENPEQTTANSPPDLRENEGDRLLSKLRHQIGSDH
jgi:hypothetical protein